MWLGRRAGGRGYSSGSLVETDRRLREWGADDQANPLPTIPPHPPAHHPAPPTLCSVHLPPQPHPPTRGGRGKEPPTLVYNATHLSESHSQALVRVFSNLSCVLG